MVRRWWRVSAIVVASVALAAVPATAASNPSSSWPGYHRSATRLGDAGRSSAVLTGTLRRAWTKPLDGAVYAEPVLVGSRAVVATENDTIYALNVSNGSVVWRRHLASPARSSSLPCGNIDPLGVTGTPAYDRGTGSVFVVAEGSNGTHTLYALAATSGRVRWHRSLDVVKRDRYAEQQRGAVLVAAGRVIVSFGGLFGDCGDFVGYVTSVATDGRGTVARYVVPTAREAGMWAPPGPVLAPNGRVYVSAGNGAATGGRFDGSDSVTELVAGTLRRLAIFAPSSWRSDNAGDLDLGSSGSVPISGRIVIAGKRGVVYLLSTSLGGIGRQVTSRSGCQAYGGAAARGTTAYLPCNAGVRSLHVGSRSLTWGWRASFTGSPVLAGNVVYVVDSGRFAELSQSSGRTLRTLRIPATSRFATPTVAAGGRLVLVGTMSGVVAVR